RERVCPRRAGQASVGSSSSCFPFSFLDRLVLLLTNRMEAAWFHRTEPALNGPFRSGSCGNARAAMRAATVTAGVTSRKAGMTISRQLREGADIDATVTGGNADRALASFGLGPAGARL